MDDVLDLYDGVTYICEVFEQAVDAYFVTYGEKPSVFIISPIIYNYLEFEFGTQEPKEFMGCDIIINDSISTDQFLLF